MSMKGKTAIVTGASKGIGYAAMEMLVKEGVNVVAVSRNLPDLESAAAALRCETGADILTIPADISKEEGAVMVLWESVQRFGNISYLLNCAGVSQREGCQITEICRDEFQRIMDSNINSTLYMCREFLKTASTGYIINILSTAAYDTGAGGIMYSASKYAARAVTEGIEKGLKGTKMRITSISPGPVSTNIWSHKVTPVSDEKKSKMLNPKDIAIIIEFLLKTDDNVHIPDIKVEPWFYKK